jgi:hypothetical protein
MTVEPNGSDGQADETADVGAVSVPAVSPVKTEDDPLGFLHAATKRNFGETEVTSAITIRFLVEKVKDQRDDIGRLRHFEGLYYQADKELQIEKSKTKLGKTQEIVSAALLILGGAGMGFAIKFIDTHPMPSIVGFVLFAGIVASGLYLKVGSR